MGPTSSVFITCIVVALLRTITAHQTEGYNDQKRCKDPKQFGCNGDQKCCESQDQWLRLLMKKIPLMIATGIVFAICFVCLAWYCCHKKKQRDNTSNENQQIDGNDQTELLDGLEGVVEDNDDNDVAEECQHDDNDVVEEYQHYDIADNNVTVKSGTFSFYSRQEQNDCGEPLVVVNTIPMKQPGNKNPQSLEVSLMKISTSTPCRQDGSFNTQLSQSLTFPDSSAAPIEHLAKPQPLPRKQFMSSLPVYENIPPRRQKTHGHWSDSINGSATLKTQDASAPPLK